MITVELIGDRKVIAKLQAMPATVRASLYRKVLALAIMLQTYIRTDKLSGQVLNRVSGALSRSIQQLVTQDEKAVMGRIYSAGDVKYAGIHEYGGQTKPHDIYPKKGVALKFMGAGAKGDVFAKVVHHPGSKMPERSFMRSGLRDKTVEIQLGLKEAVVVGLAQATAGG